MYERILVAIDGSGQSCKALDHAAAIAEKLGSELTLLTVVPRVTLPILPNAGLGAVTMTSAKNMIQEQEKIKDVYQDILGDAEARVRSEHPDLNVSTILREGRPSTTIVGVVEKEGYDLIVMGSHGIRGITGWILGSTSHGVVDSCKKPVLIIKTS
jgi:nucleotide-binding universal stress UspA family protein